jgi:hypothetical protein
MFSPVRLFTIAAVALLAVIAGGGLSSSAEPAGTEIITAVHLPPRGSLLHGKPRTGAEPYQAPTGGKVLQTPTGGRQNNGPFGDLFATSGPRTPRPDENSL